MEKFNKVTEPKELEFFSIEEDHNGNKQIHIMGYMYCSDTDEGEGYWRNVEFTFCIIPLDEFIKNIREDENYLDRIESEIKQYMGDCTDEEIVEMINHYYDGNPAEYDMHYDEITMDTPCGDYCFEF